MLTMKLSENQSNDGEKNKMSNSIKIWEIREGTVKSLKINDIVFNVEIKGDENVVDIVNEFNKKIKIIDLKEDTKFKKANEIETEFEEEESDFEESEEFEPSKNVAVSLKPRMETKEKPSKRKYTKRVSQSRIQTLSPILDENGEQVKETGIPFYEEFRNAIFENFRAGEDITTQDVTKIFIEKFPDYSPSTLKNKAVAYMNWLYKQDKAEIVQLDGVKRIYRLKKISMSNDEVEDLKQRYQDDRKIFVGIL